MLRRTFLATSSAALAQPPPRSRKILLRTGWQMRNIGDVCFTPAMLAAIRQYIPEADVTCWAANIHEDARRRIRRDFPDARFLDGAATAPGKPTPPQILEAFRETDLFLYNSGMVVNYGLHGTHDLERTINSVIPFYLAANAGKPYGAWGQTFDILDPPADIVLRRILSQASFLFTRESLSPAVLRQAGVSGPHIAFAPDIAFQFRQRDDATAAAYLKSESLEPGRFLVAILHYAVLDRPGVRERGPEYVQKMREVLITWVRETRMPVLLAPEDDREIELNRQQLFDPMPADVKPYLRLRRTFWLPDEALSVFLASRTMFNMEPHGNIMALANGLPCLHCFDWAFGKKAEMFRDIGLGDWAFSLASATPQEMAAALLGIHRGYDAAQRKRQAAMRTVARLTEDGFAVVRKSLGLS